MLDVQFVGPALDAGSLPAVFYFALSAKDSLYTDPFNQPVTPFLNHPVRVFSVTLPGHDHLLPNVALHFWAEQLVKKNDILTPFLKDVCDYIQYLVDTKIVSQVYVMGLSRGVWVASHVAAKMDIIRHLLGFAPLTDLTSIAEFKTLDVAHWNLKELCIALSTKTIRCYIGNRDTRVGTDKCFDWLYQTSERAFQKGIRSPPIELRIVPSIGREGHGTAPQHFREGASWLLKQMGALHEA